MAGSEQVSCDLGDEAVILSLKDGVYYGLNAVAARVWELLKQEPRTVGKIRDIILKEFDVEEERCTQDLLDLLEQLRVWKLVELRDGKGPYPA